MCHYCVGNKWLIRSQVIMSSCIQHFLIIYFFLLSYYHPNHYVFPLDVFAVITLSLPYTFNLQSNYFLFITFLLFFLFKMNFPFSFIPFVYICTINCCPWPSVYVPCWCVCTLMCVVYLTCYWCFLLAPVCRACGGLIPVVRWVCVVDCVWWRSSFLLRCGGGGGGDDVQVDVIVSPPAECRPSAAKDALPSPRQALQVYAHAHATHAHATHAQPDCSSPPSLPQHCLFFFLELGCYDFFPNPIWLGELFLVCFGIFDALSMHFGLWRLPEHAWALSLWFL